MTPHEAADAVYPSSNEALLPTARYGMRAVRADYLKRCSRTWALDARTIIT